MTGCRKLELFLERGKFGEHLSDLPEKMIVHIEKCEDCQKYYKELLEIENALSDLEHEVPSMQSKARIRQGIEKSIDEKAFSSFKWFHPVWNTAAGVLLIALVVMLNMKSPVLTPSTSPDSSGDAYPETLLAQIDDSVYNELLELSEPEIYSGMYNISEDVTIKQVTDQTTENEQNLYDDITSFDSYQDVYMDEFVTDFEELDDTEWDELRRFLS